MVNTTSLNPAGKRIILADGSPEILAIVEMRLVHLYNIVGKADDGRQLIESVRNLQPDIFVTDICIPGISGIEVLHRLRSQDINIPAVIMTVYEDEELLEASLSLGALGFVLKSRIDRDLLPAIQQALEGRVFISDCASRKPRSV